ncbi:MAG: phenylalanine--tRNA ligase subunit beta, partial [Oscillospiraceae bacterium]
PELTMVALKRFVKLLKDIDDGTEITSSVTDLYVRKYPVIKFEIEKAFIDKYTGIEISNETILKTLKALDFKVELNNDAFAIEVPSFRATKDISLKADMIEEITRIYGYDNFELKTTKTPLVPVRQNPIHEEEYNAKLLLAQAAHCNEVHSYIWYNDKINSELGIKTKDNVRILNSVSPDHSMIREFIMPSLINFAYQNKQSEISIFEIGRVAKGFRQDKTCDEKKVLGILVGSKTLSEKQVFYKAKSILENLSVTLKNIKPTYDKIKEEQGFIHPYNSLSVYFNGNYGGYISTLHPVVKENLDKKLNVAMVEIEFNALVSCQRGEFVFADVSKYPGIDIDLSLSVDMDVEYKQLENIISEYKNEHLSKVSLVDIYTDDSMQNKKSVTLRFAFLSMERTLCGDEVNSYTNELIKLFEKYNITLR